MKVLPVTTTYGADVRELARLGDVAVEREGHVIAALRREVAAHEPQMARGRFTGIANVHRDGQSICGQTRGTIPGAMYQVIKRDHPWLLNGSRASELLLDHLFATNWKAFSRTNV